MKKIEKPKVFISYAWGTEDNQENVMRFATELNSDGIEVIIDKWNLEPGNDTYDYMEKCVKDISVHYVLILLDENYAKKADNRKGGVGTETQIISAEIYNNTEQTKFIPIIFSRDDNGNDNIPIFLKSRYYFDLSIQDNYYEEYQNLVRYLYGESKYKKPELGAKPSWVEYPNSNIDTSLVKYLKIIESTSPNVDKRSALKKSLLTIKNSFINIRKTDDETKDILSEYNKIIDYYNESKIIRDSYLQIVKLSFYEKIFIEEIVVFFEDFYNFITIENNSLLKDTLSLFLHEVFIYTISILYKNKCYREINNLVTRTYFINSNIDNSVNFSSVFYSYSNSNQIIEDAVKKVDNQEYYTGAGALWMKAIALPDFTKEDFVTADNLLYNLSIILLPNSWYWFPLTYIYDDFYKPNGIRQIAIRLKSKHQIQLLKELFDVEDSLGLIKKMSFMYDISLNEKRQYSYQRSHRSAPLLVEYIKKDEIGILT